MKKWAILRPATGNSKSLEVWRFLETEEEARRISHINYVFECYGVEGRLPIVLNSVGGFHTLDPDRLVKIIESEEEPVLAIEDQYPIVNHGVANGWLSPEGVLFECDSWGHSECAQRLCENKNVPAVLTAINFDDQLLYNGWMKIRNWKWFGMMEKINDKQVSVVEEFGLKGDYSYSETIELMRLLKNVRMKEQGRFLCSFSILVSEKVCRSVRLRGGRSCADSSRGTCSSGLPFSAAAGHGCVYHCCRILPCPPNGRRAG